MVRAHQPVGQQVSDKHKGPPPGAKNDAGVELSSARTEALRAEALALPNDKVRRSPGYLGRRLQWFSRVAKAARRDHASLVTVPLKPEADLTASEIHGLLEWCAFLQLVEAQFVASKTSAPKQTDDFDRKITEARKLQAAICKGIRHIFRNDSVVIRWVRDLLEGVGLADLRDDLVKLRAFWVEHSERLALLNRGEADKLEGLGALLAELEALAGGSLGTGAPLRRLRDAAYSIVSERARRIRMAAEYAFDSGAPELEDYAAFKTPKGAVGDPNDDQSTTTTTTTSTASTAKTRGAKKSRKRRGG